MGRLVDAGTLRGIEGRVTLLVRPRFHHVSVSARAPGVFRFDDLPAGPAVIYAHASGFAPYFGELTVDGGKVHERQLGLLLEAVASGKVLNSDDSAAVGANVHVGYDSSLAGADTLAGLAQGHVKTDSEGAFRIGGLVPDVPIALQAELDGRRSAIVRVTAIEPGMEQSEIVLRMQ